MKCKECGYELRKGIKFCPDCGKPVLYDSYKIICDNCHEEVDKDSKFCSKCGKQATEKYEDYKDKNRKRRRKDDDDDDEEGGIFGGISDFVGKLFG